MQWRVVSANITATIKQGSLLEALKFTSLVIFGGLFIAEICLGHYSRQKGDHNEKLVAWGSYLQQFAVVRPFIAFLFAMLAATLFPTFENSLQDWPLWPTVFGFLLLREFVQYWYHRFSHEWNWLWRLHKTHHSAEQMNVLVTSRGNIFWFLCMPTLYLEAAMIYAGLTEAYLVYFAMLSAVSISTHSALRWDLPLFNNRITGPVMHALKYVITTPDAHHAHHGMGDEANPNGNYTPMLFFYDVIFGTAKLPVKEQSQVGIPEGNVSWWRQMYSPRG